MAISGTHTHAGPGGYLQYIIYIVTSLGFVRQSFDVIVDGIEKSIIQAHENLHPGSIFVNKGRRPRSYCLTISALLCCTVHYVLLHSSSPIAINNSIINAASSLVTWYLYY